MAKWVCNVCGYVYEGDAAPEVCPVCKAPASKFTKQDAEMTWAAEHVVGVAQGVSEDIIDRSQSKLRRVNAPKLVCTLQWQELLTEKVIRKSASTGRKLLTKKLSMLQNSLNFSVKLLLTAPRKTLKCVLKPRTVLLQANSTLQNVQKLLTLMQSMTLYMKWLETKQDTAKHSPVCLRDTLVKLQAMQKCNCMTL